MNLDAAWVWWCFAVVVLAAVSLAAFFAHWDRRLRSIEADVAAREDGIKSLLRRYPLLLKMDGLTKNQLVNLIEHMPDDIAQAMAWGAASLIAGQTDSPLLHQVVELKGQFLAGELTEGGYENAFTEAIERLAYATGDYSRPRELAWQDRAVISGCSTQGHSAFALLLKHHAEGTRSEADEKADDDSADADA